MISCYFGLPGCGKTTILAKIAVQTQRQIDRGLSKYKFVYTNTEISYPGIRLIHWDAIGVYDLKSALILIDEATLYADSRRYKSFPQEKIEWFMTHRHDFCDLIYFAQFFDAVDKRMRMVTDRVFYVKKVHMTGLSTCTRIPKSIIIPEQTGEIIEGYRMPKILERLFFMKIVRRKKYYKYFNSWHQYVDRPALIEAYGLTQQDLIRAIGQDPAKMKEFPAGRRAQLMYTCSGSPARQDVLMNRFLVTPVRKISGIVGAVLATVRSRLCRSC